MIIFAKTLLLRAKEKYINYIQQILAHPTTRIKITNVAGNFSEVYAENVTTQMGYLRFYFDMNLYSLACSSEYIRSISEESEYWQIGINATLVNMEVGNTYDIPCEIVEKTTGKTVQKLTIHYTRTI